MNHDRLVELAEFTQHVSNAALDLLHEPRGHHNTRVACLLRSLSHLESFEREMRRRGYWKSRATGGTQRQWGDAAICFMDGVEHDALLRRESA